jgi:hypothetical protein
MKSVFHNCFENDFNYTKTHLRSDNTKEDAVRLNLNLTTDKNFVMCSIKPTLLTYEDSDFPKYAK